MKRLTFYRIFALMMVLLTGALSMYGASDKYFWYDGFYFSRPNYNPDSIAALEQAPDNSYLSLSGVVTIPETVVAIDTINGQPRVMNLKVNRISVRAFKDCADITEFIMPPTIRGINAWAFQGCTSLAHFELPESLYQIERNTFYGCSSLSEITIPETVKYIYDSAFHNCTNLSKVTWNAIECNRIFMWDFDGVTQLTIGDKVQSLPENFMINADITTLELPLSLKKIGYANFKNCVNLTEVIIPDSVTEIGSAAFTGDTCVTRVVMGRSVTNIRGGIFSGGKNIKQLYWNATHCPSAGSIVSAAKPVPEIIIADDVEILPSYLYSYTTVKEVTLPNSIKVISPYSFSSCKNLKSVTLPSGLISIGYSAFGGCDSITELAIPNSVTTISDLAFNYMRNLVDINLPTSLDSVGSLIFMECLKVNRIDVPKSLRVMAPDAFSTVRVNYITVEEGNPILDSRNDCNAIIETATGVLLKGSRATVMPQGITAIGDNAFDLCSGPYFYDIPEGVKSIGQWAFYRAWSLRKIIMPSTLDTIHNYAFYYTLGLDTVVCKAVVPPVVENEYAFDWWYNEHATLYVPAQSVEAYKQAEVWKKFTTIVPIGTVLIRGDVNCDGEIDINDVTALIDMLLEGDTKYHPHTDINGDYTVDITDVTTFIDWLLAGWHGHI